MVRSLTLLCLVASAACVPKHSRVENTPRWMTEKDQVRIEIVRTLIEAQDHARALELIRQMRVEKVKREELDMLQGVALRQQGMLDESETLLLKALDALPKMGEVHRELCVLYADQERFDDAVAACTRATELDEEDPAAWNNLGFLLMSGNEAPRAAREALERSVELDPNNSRYRNNLAFAQVANGDHRAALRTFLTTSTPADAHYNIGLAFERDGDNGSARTYYRRALKYDADHLYADEALARLDADSPPPIESPVIVVPVPTSPEEN